VDLFTQGYQTGNIGRKMAANLFPPGAGWSIYGAVDTHARGASLMDYPICAGAAQIALFFNNALINRATDADMSDILTSVSVKRSVSGAQFATVVENVTVKKNQTHTTAPYTITVNAGETLRVNCWGAASEGGKTISGVRQPISPGLGKTGASLTFSPDATGVDTVLSNSTLVWTLAMLLAKARIVRGAGQGHSLTTAVHNNGDSAQSLLCDSLNVPYSCVGQGGGVFDAWDDNAFHDQALLMGDVYLLLGQINACNNLAAYTVGSQLTTPTAIATFSDGTYTKSLADQLGDILKALSAMGVRCYALTENYPGPVDGNATLTDYRLVIWDGWNEWLLNSGPAYYGALLADAIDTRPGFATQPYPAGVPKPGSGTGIHDNYEEMAAELLTYFSVGGAGEGVFTPQSNSYVEAFYSLFEGGNETPGTATALPDGWSEWFFSTTESARLATNGYGHIKVVGATTKSTYAFCDTAVGGSNAEVEFFGKFISAPWVAQVNNQGLHIGFHATDASGGVGNNTAASFHHEGYSLTYSNDSSGNLRAHLRRYNPNAIQTSQGLPLLPVNQVNTMEGLAIAAGQRLSVVVQRRVISGNNRFDILTYIDGELIDTWSYTDTTISANAAVSALYTGQLYVSVGTAGDTSTTHSSGARTWDAVRLYNYDATVIATVAGRGTIYVPLGGSVAVDVDVTQSAPTAGPASGVVVTTTLVDATGAAIGATATTDAQGVARFSGADALSAADTFNVGDTFTLQVTCGGVTADLDCEVVETVGDGTGGGARSIFGGYLL
jgi:hypothetical protein